MFKVGYLFVKIYVFLTLAMIQMDSGCKQKYNLYPCQIMFQDLVYTKKDFLDNEM